MKELWELVEVLPFEIGYCRGCPDLAIHSCPRLEKDPESIECSARTRERQALYYLEKEQEKQGQQELWP